MSGEEIKRESNQLNVLCGCVDQTLLGPSIFGQLPIALTTVCHELVKA
jgi:hypothetical protein